MKLTKVAIPKGRMARRRRRETHPGRLFMVTVLEPSSNPACRIAEVRCAGASLERK